MKKIGLFLGFLCVVIVFASCSEDFKVGAPYKESMVVYGLLDKGDTAHYIKITKGFFDEKGNNLTAAQNIDSIYYDSITVTMSKLNNGSVIENYTLQKVNLKDEGIVKDSGVFINKPAFAYKFKTAINPDFQYRLTIVNPKTNKVVTCLTNALENNASVFVVDNPASNSTLFFEDPDGTTDFLFVPSPNAAIVEMYLRFKYYEVTLLGGNDSVAESKEADLPIFTRLPAKPGQQMNYVFENKNFFGLIAGGLGNASPNVRRYVDTPDVVFYLGGKELKTYIDITNAQGGITADQIQPIYTNMQGENAFGILSSRVKRLIPNIPYSKKTIDSLLYSKNATNLRIVGISPK
jgi:hypothetical protein